MASNRTNLLCMDSLHRYSYFDSNLNNAIGPDLSEVRCNMKIKKTPLDIEMSDKYLFLLYSSQILKIFDLKTFDLVHEIVNVNANQLKLVSTNYLAAFNSVTGMVYLYRQDDDFAFQENVNLAKSLDAGLILVRDKTPLIHFLIALKGNVLQSIKKFSIFEIILFNCKKKQDNLENRYILKLFLFK